MVIRGKKPDFRHSILARPTVQFSPHLRRRRRGAITSRALLYFDDLAQQLMAHLLAGH